MEQILNIKKLDEKYTKVFAENMAEWKKAGIENSIIKKFHEWSDENIFYIEELDPKLEFEERFLDFDKISFNNFSNFIINALKDERFAIFFEYFEIKILDYFGKIKKDIKNKLSESLKTLDSESTYRPEKNCDQLTEAIILDSISDEKISKALIDLANVIYKSLIKFFLYNQEIMNKMPEIIEKKPMSEKKLRKVITNVAKLEYLKFDKLYFAKIKMYGDKIDRLFDSWLYEWENLTDVVTKYIQSEDYLFYSKLLAKINVGDII